MPLFPQPESYSDSKVLGAEKHVCHRSDLQDWTPFWAAPEVVMGVWGSTQGQEVSTFLGNKQNRLNSLTLQHIFSSSVEPSITLLVKMAFLGLFPSVDQNQEKTEADLLHSPDGYPEEVPTLFCCEPFDTSAACVK